MTDLIQVPRELLERFPEINYSNYGQDEVEALQAWAFEVVECLAQPAAQVEEVDSEPRTYLIGYKTPRGHGRCFNYRDDGRAPPEADILEMEQKLTADNGVACAITSVSLLGNP